MADLDAQIKITAVDRASATAKRVAKSIRGIEKAGRDAGKGLSRSPLGRFMDAGRDVGKGVTNLGKSYDRVSRSARTLALQTAVLGGAGLLVGRDLIQTAASFERYEAILKTVEGSSMKSRKAMDWISKFAAKTPFEMDEVTGAFVKLRTFGIEPTDGTLKTLGDTAAAMGKSIDQAVEAIADAETGEFERLKEFGIKGGVKGNRATFTFTDKDGNQQVKTVDKRNRKIVRSTLLAIWNSKYEGAMDEQSKTWLGMVSNLSDQWTRFKLKIMEAGVFELLSKELQGLLAWVDRMAANGSLERWAKQTAAFLKDVIKEAKRLWPEFKTAATEIVDAVKSVVEAVGGWKNALIGVGILMSARTVLSVGQLAGSILGLTGRMGKLILETTGLGDKLKDKLIPRLGRSGDVASKAGPMLTGFGGAARIAGRGVKFLGRMLGRLVLPVVMFLEVLETATEFLESHKFSEMVGMPKGITLAKGLEQGGAKIFEAFNDPDPTGIARNVTSEVTKDMTPADLQRTLDIMNGGGGGAAPPPPEGRIKIEVSDERVRVSNLESDGVALEATAGASL